MTTSIDSTSPFTSSSTGDQGAQEPPINMGDASIHTMQDDLLDLQKNPEKLKVFTEMGEPKKTVPILTPESPVKMAEVSQDMSFSRPRVNQFASSDKKEASEIPIPEKKDVSTNEGGHKIALISTLSLIVILVLVSGYYFLIIKRSSSQPTVSPTETAPPFETQQENASLETNVSAQKYSSEKPNYLTIDIETLSPEDIQRVLIDTIEELKALPKNQAPYEFITVDTNNNPIAFPIFATATKLNLSPSILNDLGENFSLFVYNDNGNWRLSFAADISKNESFSLELLKQEKTFITDAAFLFLNEKPEITKGLFKSSIYNGIPIRFFNVNSQITMSIDYTIIGNKLVVATSKNTVRAVIDKLITETAPAP